MSIEENAEWMGLKKAQKQLKKAMENVDEARDWLSSSLMTIHCIHIPCPCRISGRVCPST